MAKKTIPQSAGNAHTDNKKTPTAITIDYLQTYPCWRIGNFDYKSKWGLNNLGKFKFTYSEAMLNIVISVDNERLNVALENLDSRYYSSLEAFWSDFKRNYSEEDIPINLIECIEKEAMNNAFVEKIYPKLKSFENNTWDEIRKYSHRKKDKSVSNNHNVSISKLCKDAQDRLIELGYSDYSEIYSLRLEGTIRLYGFRKMNYLDIIWVDLDHEVYPLK